MFRRTVSVFRLLPAVLVMLAIAGSIGCRQSTQLKDSSDDVEISLIYPLTEPQAIGKNPLGVRLATSDGRPIPRATVELRSDMTHAGMVPVIRAAEATDADGEYLASIEWTMAGDWIVTVTATLPDGRVVSQGFPIVVAPTVGGSE